MKIKRTHFLSCLLSVSSLFTSISVSLAAGKEAELTTGALDENALFSDSNSVIDTTARFNAHKDSTPEQKSVGVSGSVISFAQVNLQRSYFPAWDAQQSSMAAGAVGSALLDVRMQKGFRAFADIEWNLDPNKRGDSAVVLRVPETFLDANINHKVWFRMGKQVLQWGRGYFFNPTDLINVERKTFFRRIGGREGVFGAKVQVPFGTKANLYGFLDGNAVTRPDSLSGAIKAEFLWGRTEFALMAWDGGGRTPVYGTDLSSRLLGFDITTEVALHQVVKTKSLQFIGGLPILIEQNKDWQSRAAFGLGRNFTVAGIPNRITTVAEYYFNQPGSSENKMPFANLLQQPTVGVYTQQQALLAAGALGIYEPNSYSQHYLAFFGSFNHFIRSEITLSFNTISNLNQNCSLLSTAISYRDLNDFGLTLSLNSFAGSADKEYTLSKQALQIQIIAEAAY